MGKVDRKKRTENKRVRDEEKKKLGWRLGKEKMKTKEREGWDMNEGKKKYKKWYENDEKKKWRI